jgi:uncharacterized protein
LTHDASLPIALARKQRLRRVTRITGAVLCVMVVLYGLILIAMTVFQRRLQYRPDASLPDPALSGFASATVIELTTPDGERLKAWWKEPSNARQAIYLYLHGNAANLARRGTRLNELARNGAGVLALSWRGYGGSSGEPSERGLHLDANAAYRWLQDKGYPARIIIVYGESLGTGVAVRLAAERDVGGLILDSPYSSTADIAARRYPWLPVRFLMLDQFRADLSAPRLRVPVLAYHCRQDRIVPYQFGEKLLDLVPTPKRFITIEDACHVPSIARDGLAQLIHDYTGERVTKTVAE